MARELDQDELVEHWTLIGDDLDRVAGKRGAAKLGFALLLKFFAARGRFPRGRSELPPAAVEFVAKQLQLSVADLGFYVNTRMLQDVLAEDAWARLLSSEDYRGLIPLIWAT
ncbi:DUF4158 domain-containing protein [Bounagaea algeriensis]